MMKGFEVQRDSHEWNRMWAELASKDINSGDTECVHPETLESWQYMGSSCGVHSFRHRNHPVTGKREYLQIPAK
ncbi:4-diphosphocytidyl-2C-methyl-D-erythritol kinase [Aeromonas hydrophila]|uniref:4-diphosphocytidyl-2C-methyl-D-erythritol kinase n=1 Tax=Aeromonas hydrophila TaxID=644 RepID=UPI000ABEC5A5|nr:4-diphosphocytidyl-2C-methyl-D-erythritol kinase [Aeromonas hydrophila]